MTRGSRTPHSGLAVLVGGVAGLLVLAGGYVWLLGGTRPAPDAVVGGPFELTATDGRVVSDRSFRGRYLLIYFGYASCRDVCPLTLRAEVAALRRLGARGDAVQPIFITVDPGRDTPERLAGYVARFSPVLVGLTGTAAQLRAVERAYRVSAVADGAAAGQGGAIAHSSVLLLVGPDGRYLAPIRADQTAAEMAADIARNLQDGRISKF